MEECHMIATCFPARTQWAWEILSIDGRVLASGSARTESQGRRASTAAWLDAQVDWPGVIDLALARDVHFGGSHAAPRPGSGVGRP
jgi:hypothetical protein